MTKLIEPSVAVCGWIVSVEAARVVGLSGKVPTKVMARIARAILAEGG